MLTRDDLTLVSSLCRKRAGLRIDPAKAYQVECRIAPLCRREQLPTSTQLVDRVRGGDDRLAWALVEALAQGETSFFRDRLPFDQFETDLLPMFGKAQEGRALRIWSAGCGSGQEIYSLAMAAAQLPFIPVEFLATDINENALRKAQSGLYTQFEIQRGLPARMLVEHFEQAGDAWRISDRLRSEIKWRRLNLIGDLTDLGQFDIIFCRNVLCLLEESFQARVLQSLSARLSPDGVLVLGLKESAHFAGGTVTPVEGRPGLYRRGDNQRAA